MFKIIAALAVTAGGAAYGLYTYTDLLGDGSAGGCPLSRKACSPQPAPAAPESDCCREHEACCEEVSPCCSAGKVAAKVKPAAGSGACCASKPTAVAALCCADPCLACVFLACDGCAECATCCGAGADNARAAVAGPAAVFAATK